MALEEARHLGRGLQEPIGEALAPEAGVIDGAALTNAGHDVLEHPALRRVIEHVVRRDGRHASRTGCFLKPVEPQRVVWPEAPGQGQIGAVAEVALQAPQATGKPVVDPARHENDNLPFAPRGHIVPAEPAGALTGPPLTDRQKPAKPAVGGAIRRIDQHRRPVLKVETASDDEPNACGLRGIVGPHDPGKRVAIDDAERRDPEHRSLREQFLGARCAAQETEVGRDLKLGVGHAKSPCRNHRTPSTAGPSRKTQ